MKRKIAVIFGGCTAEYEVSLQSAYAVLTHINHEKYHIIPIGITRDGTWLRYDGSYDLIPADQWANDPAFCCPAILSPDRSAHGLWAVRDGRLEQTCLDAVFPVLHGRYGEDGTIQGLAELAGIPIVGCGTLASALCMDKHRAHLMAEAAGVKSPKSVYFDSTPTERELSSSVQHLTFPLYVKPLRAGSSFGITKTEKPEQLAAAVERAFQYDSEILIEEYIPGFEVGCAVLGWGRNLILGRVDEIQLDCDFFDYTEKYTQQNASIYMPARIDAETEQRIQTAASRIYRILGCSGFARVDLFLTPEKEIVFNEVNTIPGFTAVSRYPNMLRGVGLSYENIIEKLIMDALPF